MRHMMVFRVVSCRDCFDCTVSTHHCTCRSQITRYFSKILHRTDSYELTLHHLSLLTYIQLGQVSLRPFLSFLSLSSYEFSPVRHLIPTYGCSYLCTSYVTSEELLYELVDTKNILFSIRASMGFYGRVM